jgi:hypothetical protein
LLFCCNPALSISSKAFFAFFLPPEYSESKHLM